MKDFKYSKYTLIFFVIRRNITFAVVWALVFSLIVVSNALGTKAVNLNEIAASFGNNAGLNALYGPGYMLNTPEGFTVWKSFGLIVIIAALWGMIISVNSTRGEEEAGRLELFLAGKNSTRVATLFILLGLFFCIFLAILISSLIIIPICNSNGLHFSIGNTFVFILSLFSSAAEFVALGAFLSQIFSTKRIAMTISVALYCIFYLIRMIGDTKESLNFLVNISPFGWIENIQPLTGNYIFWFIPIIIFTVSLLAISIYLSGKRDLYGSIITLSSEAKSHLILLNSEFGLILRENLIYIFSWFIGIFVLAFIAGVFSNLAGEAIKSSKEIEKGIDKFAGNNSQIAFLYISVMFLIVMLLMMMMTINFVNRIRNEEFQGYLDNLLVRKVRRTSYILNQMVIICVSIIIAGIGSGIFAWLGAESQNIQLSFNKLILSGVNMIAPSIFVLGIGLLIFGFKPRLIMIISYAIIAWSFLVDLIGPSINLSKDILNTSLFYNLALAPSVDPKWTTVSVLCMLGLIGCVLGIISFNKRDLESE